MYHTPIISVQHNKFHNVKDSLELFGASGYEHLSVPGLYGGWIHLTIIFNDKTATVYANGKLAGNVTLTESAKDSSPDLAFGCLPTGGDQAYPGCFDEIRIRPGIMTTDEVRANWAVMHNPNIIVPSAVCNRNSSKRPTLSIDRVQDGAEFNQTPAHFKISLSSPCRQDLSVPYTISGTATVSTDYVAPSPATVLIPAGATSADIKIIPCANQASEQSPSLIVKLAASEDYQLDSLRYHATAIIVNAPQPRLRDYRRSIRFTVASSMLEGKTLRDFPILVRISPDSIPDVDMTEIDPERLTFCNGASNIVVPYEIDTWHPGEELLVWVILPEVTKGTSFTLHYARRSGFATPCRLRPWENYAGVWHFNEMDAVSPAQDSSPHKLHAKPMRASVSLAGVIGSARTNRTPADTSDSAFLVPATDDISLGSTFTFSCWALGAEGVNAQWQRLLGRKTSWDARNGFEIELASDSQTILARGGSGNSIEIPTPTLTSQWTHLVVSINRNRDDATLTAYVNGQEVASGTIDIPFSNHLPWALGGVPESSASSIKIINSFMGSFDEVRMLPDSVDATWAKASYETVTDNEFLNIGDVQTNPLGLFIVIR